MATLASALDVPIEKVTAFAKGLAPGIRLVGERIQFRDEDFETFVRGRVDDEAVVEAHGRLSDLFLEQRATSADAAAHVATHLYLAKRLTELVGLVLAEDSPAGIADGFRREQVQMERLRLAALAVAETGSASDAVRLAARGCDTSSRSKSLSELVDSHMDLVAQYADVDLLQAYAPRHGDTQWLGPVWMRLAGVLSRDPQRQAETRNALDKAGAWVRHWMASQDKEGRSWEVGADDVAAAAEARYRLEGMQAAISMLRRWRPASFVVEVTERLAARLAEELDTQEAYDALTRHRVPAHAQAPVLAHLGSASSPPPTEWVDEVTAALTRVPATEPHPPWHRKLLDVALRFGDRQSALALAEHWASELPTSQRAFTSPSSPATITLYSHAASAALSDTQTDAEQLLPDSLRPPAQGTGHSYDPHTSEREGWVKRVDPLITAGLLHVRAVLGQADAGDVEASARLACRRAPNSPHTAGSPTTESSARGRHWWPALPSRRVPPRASSITWQSRPPGCCATGRPPCGWTWRTCWPSAEPIRTRQPACASRRPRPPVTTDTTPWTAWSSWPGAPASRAPSTPSSAETCSIRPSTRPPASTTSRPGCSASTPTWRSAPTCPRRTAPSQPRVWSRLWKPSPRTSPTPVSSRTRRC